MSTIDSATFDSSREVGCMKILDSLGKQERHTRQIALLLLCLSQGHLLPAQGHLRQANISNIPLR